MAFCLCPKSDIDLIKEMIAKTPLTAIYSSTTLGWEQVGQALYEIYGADAIKPQTAKTDSMIFSKFWRGKLNHFVLLEQGKV